MNGLNQLAASDHVVAIAGRSYRLSLLSLSDYGEIENRILAARPDARTAVRQRLAERTDDQRREELGRLFEQVASARHVSLGDLDRWWQTPDAFVYRFWMMVRKDRAAITLEEAEELLRGIGDEDRAALARRMEDCHGWPSTAPALAASGADSQDEGDPLPWYRWAIELSRAYGWSPAEIGRMTIAQMWIYLGQSGESMSRQRMSLTEGMALCHRRGAERQRWVDRMMEGVRDDA